MDSLKLQNKGAEICPFFLVEDSMLSDFFKIILKEKGIEHYITSSIEFLYVINDLNSNPIIINETYLNSLPQDFFKSNKNYILITENEDLVDPNFTKEFKFFLKKPISIDKFLETLNASKN